MKFLLALLAFCLLNVWFFGLAGTSKCRLSLNYLNSLSYAAQQEAPWVWWALRAYFNRETRPDVVLFGSSQMATAMIAGDLPLVRHDIDAVTYKDAHVLENSLASSLGGQPQVFNFAMGGEMVSDAVLIERATFLARLTPSLVIIGVNPRDFMDNTCPIPASTPTFHFLKPFVDLQQLSWSSYFPLDGWLEALPLKHWAATLTAGFSSTGPEPLQAPALSTVTRSADAVRPGFWVSHYGQPESFFDNTGEYKSRYRTTNPQLYEQEQKFFEAFLADMRARAIPVLVVGMPSLPVNRSLLPDQFWRQFRLNVSASCRRYGASWIDLTDSPLFVFADYHDTVHLNAGGASKLCQIVAQQIAAAPELAHALRPRLNQACVLQDKSIESSASSGKNKASQ